MDDDAGRVQGPPQPRAPRPGELLPKAVLEIPGISSRLYVLARAREDRPGGLDRERVVASPCEHVHRRQVAEPHCASAFSAGIGTSAQFSS